MPPVSDEQRWQAVRDRDPAFDGQFFYSVRTTGVYCRTVCPSRLAKRENVRFHTTQLQAEHAGFRPCKRCRPNEPTLVERQSASVAQACRLIEIAIELPTLDELANAVGLSRYHFHRVFKSHTGLTPKQYADAHRSKRVRDELLQTDTVTEAIYGAGFQSNGRFYASATEVLGMTPTKFRDGGDGLTIRFAFGTTSLGSILVASTDKGVCAIFIDDDRDALVRELQERFPDAELVGGDTEFEQIVAQVVAFVEEPQIGFTLPLDIRGTAFQQRVWQALREIPLGTTVTYTDIARKIGKPKAVRAVGAACGANHIGVLIPCHRVVGTNGKLTGYRWGVERKKELLRREKESHSE